MPNDETIISEGLKDEVSCLHFKALEFLIKKMEKLGLPQKAILPYPDVNLILSSMLHLSKDEVSKVLKELSHLGLVELVNYHGIRIIR